MIGNYHLVTCDLYDIASRLKAIDEDYFVLFCYKTKKYEIHNKGQRGSTLSLVLPYPHLDARALSLVRQTRTERADQLFRELNFENKGKNFYGEC